jgi:phytoene desaturase
MAAPKIIVVGAGPGGLASAMLLAAAGCSVKIVEKRAHVGGRTSSIRQAGFTFDRGPTFFLYPEVLASIFTMCGRALHEEIDLIRLDPSYRLVFERGGTLDASSDVEELKRQVGALEPADALGVERYIADNRRKLAAFKRVLESPFDRHMDLLKLPLSELLPLARPWSSVDRDLKRFFRDPRVRLAFSFQSKYLGMSPFRCPSLFTILAFLEFEYGVYHPVGGCGAVSAAMARVAREMGVEIALDTPVEEVLLDGRRARGVRTREGRHECDAIVVNADFANAMRELVPNRLRRRWTDERIARKKMSCSTFMMYLGIEGRYEHLPHHTILLADGYEELLADIDRHRRLPLNPAVYVCNPSIVDSSVAPDGMSALYVLAPVTHNHTNIDWARDGHAFRALVIKQLGKLGLDDLPRRIREEIVYTPQDWESDMGLYKGATFSLSHSLDQMLSLRPHNRFEDLDGVYLAGGGTHPGSGLPVIYQSAKISSRLIAEDFGMTDPWQVGGSPVSVWSEPLGRHA